MKPNVYPYVCPMCRSHDITEFDKDAGDDYLTVDWNCESCQFQWQVEYEFIKWEPL